MEGLKVEKNKRERDLQMLKNSEPKLRKELETLIERIHIMQKDMSEFQDIDSIRRKFESTKKELEESKLGYIKRRDSIKQQVMSASTEYEQLKKTLNGHETAREMDDSEKRLRHNERNIFELRELVESKGRESDYLGLKSSCVKMMDTLNLMNVRKSGGVGK